jgi:hypothetical protein
MSDQNFVSGSVPHQVSLPKRALSGWQNKLRLVLSIFTVAAFVLIGLAKIITWGDLPGCDSDGVKSGLSDIFKQANLEFSRYIQIKTMTTTKEEITCNATLAKSAGGTGDFDYRVFFDDKTPKVVITRAEDKP